MLRVGRAVALTASVLVASACVIAGLLTPFTPGPGVVGVAIRAHVGPYIDPEPVPILSAMSSPAIRFTEHELGVQLDALEPMPAHSVRYCTYVRQTAGTGQALCAPEKDGTVMAAHATATFAHCPPGWTGCTAEHPAPAEVIVVYQSIAFTDSAALGILHGGQPTSPSTGSSTHCLSGPGMAKSAGIYDATTEQWIASVGALQLDC